MEYKEINQQVSLLVKIRKRANGDDLAIETKLLVLEAIWYLDRIIMIESISQKKRAYNPSNTGRKA